MVHILNLFNLQQVFVLKLPKKPWDILECRLSSNIHSAILIYFYSLHNIPQSPAFQSRDYTLSLFVISSNNECKYIWLTKQNFCSEYNTNNHPWKIFFLRTALSLAFNITKWCELIHFLNFILVSSRNIKALRNVFSLVCLPNDRN